MLRRLIWNLSFDLTNKFGRGCVDAMMRARAALKKRFPDASDDLVLRMTLATRRGWSVAPDGAMSFRSCPTGHRIDGSTTLAELTYTVITVELARRLGTSAPDALGGSLGAANDRLTELGEQRERVPTYELARIEAIRRFARTHFDLLRGRPN
jgi:hypothetical protein